MDEVGFSLENPNGDWTSKFSGAGPVDSVAALIKSTERDDGEDLGLYITEIGLNSLAVGLDALAFVLDPFGSVVAASVGWLIEHIGVLREPLDQLAGDPDNVQAFAKRFVTEAQRLKDASKLAEETLKRSGDWQGAARDGAGADLSDVQGLIMKAGAVMDKYTNDAMIVATVVAATRALIRDLIAALVAHLVVGALVALAAAWATGGASMAAFGAYAAARAGALMAQIGGKLSTLFAFATKMAGRLGRSGKAMDDIAGAMKPAGAVKPANATRSADAPTPPSVAKPADATTPPTATKPGDTTTPPSTTKPGDIATPANPSSAPAPKWSSGRRPEDHAEKMKKYQHYNGAMGRHLEQRFPKVFKGASDAVESVNPAAVPHGTFGKEIFEVSKEAGKYDESSRQLWQESKEDKESR